MAENKLYIRKTIKLLTVACIFVLTFTLILASCTKPEHDPVAKKVVDPTCDAMGYTEYYCEHCDEGYYADYTDALGHDYGESAIIGGEGCTERTVYESLCSRCGNAHRYSKAASGHDYLEVSEDSAGITYECQLCHEILVLAADQTLEEFVGSEELFGVEPSFSFDVTASTEHNEQYIRENLTILDSYFYGTDKEGEALIEYALSGGNGNWTVSFPEGYEYGATYVAKLSEDVHFTDYKANELFFGIMDDPDHENEHQYKDGMVFVRALENASAGYYPLELNTSPNSNYIYLTLGKTDGIAKGQTLCVGEVTDASQITADTVCTIGKVEDIYEISSGKWMIVMSAPELTDVFDELDVIYSGDVNFDDSDVDVQQLGAQIEDAFYKSEQFAEFLGAVNLSANRYLADRGYHSSVLYDLNTFAAGVKIDPQVRVSGTTLFAKLNGTITLDVKDVTEKQVGTLTISFGADIESSFAIDAKYKTKKWGLVSLPSVNVSIKQTDDIAFDFVVAVDIDGLESTGYVRNKETGEIHLACCVEVTRASDASHFEKINSSQVNEGGAKCTRCRPQNGASLENDFNSYYVDTLYCSDWERVVSDIKKITSANTEKGARVHLKTLDIPIGGTPVKIGLDFGVSFSFELGAIMDYSCEYSQTSVYGMRLNLDDVQVFSKKETARFNENDFSIIGDASVQTGISVEVSIGISGLKKCDAGLIADVGAYADISGVRDTKQDIAGAYLEVGAFYDVDAYYQFFSLSDSLGVSADKYPVQKYGYDRLYFSYDVYHDTLDVGESCDIAAEDLLVVRYYDIRSMQIKTEELSLSERNKYKVTLSLGDGTYCEIKNGKVVVKEISPEKFTDTLTITVSSQNGWGQYKRGKSAFCLGVYTITLEFERDCVHSWADADCTTPKTCTKCGTTSGSALGHGYDYVYNNDATCTKNGTETATCSICGNVNTRTVWGTAFGHECDQYVPDKKATCTNNATEIAFCTRCEKNVSRDIEGTALGHTPGTWTTVKEPAETTNGTKQSTCTICNALLLEDIPLLGTKGLTYSLNSDGKSYSVSGKSCTEAVVLIPEFHNNLPVTEISSSAFKGNSKITSIIIPKSVTWIGDGAFYCCTNLKEIVIPYGVTTIHHETFVGCTNLISATIPDSVETIGYSAFTGCTNLTNLKIPDSVTTIENSAFAGCSSLVSITLSQNITYMGIGLFQYCTSLTSISIPNGITNIGEAMFSQCSGLTDVIIPDSVTNIGDIAFYQCTSLTNIIIPNGVTSIGEHAFYGCTSLTNATIAGSVETIGYCAFSGCTKLTNVTIENGVTDLGGSTFRDCTNLKSIVIPDSVTRINYDAFSGCTSLKSIVIPDSVTIIDSGAFYGCTSLTNIIIPKNVTSIESSAFSNCTSLTSIIIPNNVTTLGIEVFSNCTSLANVTIGNGITYISEYLFSNCTSLSTIVIPESVSFIGVSAFRGCSNLTSVVIPGNIMFIEVGAFHDTKSLKVIYYGADEGMWNYIQIDSLNNNLSRATKYYYSTTKPNVSGNYWHFVEGVPTKW